MIVVNFPDNTQQTNKDETEANVSIMQWQKCNHIIKVTVLKIDNVWTVASFGKQWFS